MNRILSYYILVFIAFMQLNTAFGQASGEKYRLLTYGLPNFGMQNAEYVVAEKWGIEYYAVAGCVVSQELIDSVEKHNDAVEPLIKKKYGEDWYKKFQKEVEAEYEIEQKVIALLDQLDYIVKKKQELDKEGNGLDYTMSPVKKTSKYEVSVSGWGILNGQPEWVSYYRLLVDHQKKTVQLLDDSIIKE